MKRRRTLENDETREIDATDSVAGLIIRRNPDRPDLLTCDAWANGISKTGAAAILRQIADSWEADVRAELSGWN
jgi:hypothetical protein